MHLYRHAHKPLTLAGGLQRELLRFPLWAQHHNGPPTPRELCRSCMQHLSLDCIMRMLLVVRVRRSIVRAFTTAFSYVLQTG